MPGPVGTEPVHLASEPSALARSITLWATFFPSSRPAVTSLGYCTPASSRDCTASCALASNVAASSGYRYDRIADAAPATTACRPGKTGCSGWEPAS